MNLEEVRAYVNEHVVDFHAGRITSLSKLRLEKLLTKNPYLLKAKNITTAGDLITNLLQAFLSSSEEELFGQFLEGLAIFVAERTCNGHKSTAPGIDVEFFNRGIHYVVSVKSGPNWGRAFPKSGWETSEQVESRIEVGRIVATSGGEIGEPLL